MFIISSDPSQTSTRLRDLDAYMEHHVLTADKTFMCGHAAECRDSFLKGMGRARGHPQGGFYEGQLHHVGRYYDLSLNGTPFRIAIVGQEYGHPPTQVVRVERTEMILRVGREGRFKAEPGHGARNPHMRGTTSVLRLLLGLPLGSDYAGEFITLRLGAVHIFEAFALTNFLLCSAIEVPRTRSAGQGRSTPTMQNKCARHFRRAMEILEPTVIVVQGLGVRSWLEKVFNRFERIDHGLPLERVYLDSRTMLLAAFAHTSARGKLNWGLNETMPYLVRVVGPTVSRLHQELGLTSVTRRSSL